MIKKLFVLLALLPATTFAWDLKGVGNFKFERFVDSIYIMHGPLQEPNKQNQGFMNNPGIIVADKGIIVVDPGSTVGVGEQVLKEIKKVSKKPILAVFNSHIHGDHWLANQAIKKAYPKVKIYGHANMIEQAKQEPGKQWLGILKTLTEGLSAGTKVVAPDFSVKQGDIIEVAGQHFRLHVMIPAHTDTDIMVEHVESKTLFMGDNAFNKRMARFDSSSNMHGALKVLAYVQGLGLKNFVPGHGLSGSYDFAVKPFHDYLIQMQKIVKAGLGKELEDYEIKAAAEKQLKSYRSWPGYDENFGKHVFKMYLEIEALEL